MHSVIPLFKSNIKGNNIWKNYHLWVIIFLILVIIALYDVNLFVLKNRWEWLWYITIIEYKYSINGSILYVPFIYAALVFGWRGITITWLSSMVLILPRVLFYAPEIKNITNNILFLTAPIMMVWVVVLLSKMGEKDRRIYKEREAERQAYTLEAFRVREAERRQLAQLLHDQTIQTLIAAANKIQSLINNDSFKLPSGVIQQLNFLGKTIYLESENLRKISTNLMPSILDDLGLVEALRSLVANLDNDVVKARLEVYGNEIKLPPTTDVIIFRFVQEALSNVRRHSEAKEGIVSLHFRDQRILIKVTDNGKGFAIPAPLSRFTSEGRLGIIGMEEKARFLNGTFNIESEPGYGTSVSMEFKIENHLTITPK